MLRSLDADRELSYVPVWGATARRSASETGSSVDPILRHSLTLVAAECRASAGGGVNAARDFQS